MSLFAKTSTAIKTHLRVLAMATVTQTHLLPSRGAAIATAKAIEPAFSETSYLYIACVDSLQRDKN